MDPLWSNFVLKLVSAPSAWGHKARLIAYFSSIGYKIMCKFNNIKVGVVMQDKVS